MSARSTWWRVAVAAGMAWGATVLSTWTAGATRPAQAGPPPEQKDAPRGFLLDPAQMLEQAVRDSARRYMLDDDQKAITREIFADHGKRFFDKHLEEIRALQLEGMKLRLSGEEDPETVKALAKRFKTIFDAARETLEAAGDDFHEILDEDQAKQHDTDRRNLREGLDKAVDMIDRTIADGVTPWTRARMDSGVSEESQRRQMRWSGGGLVEREWEGWVEAAIVHWKFDDRQAGRARQMVDLAKKDAAEYRKAREKEIGGIVEGYRKLRTDEKAGATKSEIADRRKALDKEAAGLEEPLDKMFRDLKEAVETLTTEEQRRRHGPFGKPARR